MYRGAGPGGVNASQIQLWLKKNGRFSKFLCKELALFIEGLSNESSPWAAMQAFMAEQLLTLNKLPKI